MPTKLTPEIISAAIEGFESQKTKLDGQIAELRSLLAGLVIHPTVAEHVDADLPEFLARLAA
jgi:hypothetical protein